VEVELGRSGARLDGQPVGGDQGPLERVLGPPTRTVAVERPIPGLERHAQPERVQVWDDTGLIAGPGFLMVVLGENLLREPIWPAQSFPGAVLIDRIPLDVGRMTLDPLRDQRYHQDIDDHHVTVFTDWRGVPTKLVLTWT
jgi:hypothetical protein